MSSISGETRVFDLQHLGDTPSEKIRLTYQSSSYTPPPHKVSPEILLEGILILEPEVLGYDKFWFHEEILSVSESLKSVLKLLASWKSNPEKMDILDIVASSYESKIISLGRAAELTELKYMDLITEFSKKGIKLFFGPETIEKAEEESRIIREMLVRRREEGTAS